MLLQTFLKDSKLIPIFATHSSNNFTFFNLKKKIKKASKHNPISLTTHNLI